VWLPANTAAYVRRMTRTHKAALITGASSGIGAAFTRAFPETTALLLTGRNREALDAQRQALTTDHRRVECLDADLATMAGIEAVVSAADNFGIDLLIANAGVGPFGPFLQAPEQALRDTIAVNVMATTLLVRRLLPGLLARARVQGSRAGLIVVASSAAFVPVPNLAVYAASKAFDLSLTEALAAELVSEPVDVLALCPTATRSRFAERSGYRGGVPGAQDPGHVARAALAALGRRRTLVLGAVSGPALSVVAVARAASAQAISLVTRRLGRT
jgi:uncharacterized protein